MAIVWLVEQASLNADYRNTKEQRMSDLQFSGPDLPEPSQIAASSFQHASDATGTSLALVFFKLDSLDEDNGSQHVVTPT